MRTVRAGAFVLGVTLGMLVLPAPASAHGPCNCSFPQLGDPGVRVTTRSPAYKIVFNPRPADYQAEMASAGYASAYRAGAPTATVLSRSVRKPVRRATFRVPEVPPGVYLVLIFDGSEGGTHSTWDYFHVFGPAPQARPTAVSTTRRGGSDEDGIPPWLLLGGIAGGLLAGALGARMLRERRDSNPRPPA